MKSTCFSRDAVCEAMLRYGCKMPGAFSYQASSHLRLRNRAITRCVNFGSELFRFRCQTHIIWSCLRSLDDKGTKCLQKTVIPFLTLLHALIAFTVIWMSLFAIAPFLGTTRVYFPSASAVCSHFNIMQCAYTPLMTHVVVIFVLIFDPLFICIVNFS